MALTADQKEANRVARRERDRAFNVRYKTHRERLEAGRAAILAEIQPEYDAAKAVLDGIDAERSVSRRSFEERIAQLTAERDAADEAYKARWREARQIESAIWRRKMDADRELDRSLDAEYPDLVGTHGSVAAWDARRQAAAPEEAGREG